MIATAKQIALPGSFVVRRRYNGKTCPSPSVGLIGCWSTKSAPYRIVGTLDRAAAAQLRPAASCGSPQSPKRAQVCRVRSMTGGWTVELSAYPVLGATTNGSPGITLGATRGSIVTLTVTR